MNKYPKLPDETGDPRDARIAELEKQVTDKDEARATLAKLLYEARRDLKVSNVGRDELKVQLAELGRLYQSQLLCTMDRVQERDNARQELAKACVENAELKAQVDDLGSQLAEATGHGNDSVTHLKARVEELEVNGEDLSRLLQNAEASEHHLLKERDELRAQIAELRKALAEETKACEALRAVDMQIVGERDELRTQLAKERAESYEILQKILDEKVVVEDRLAEANAKYEQLDSEGAGMLQELRRLRKDLAALKPAGRWLTREQVEAAMGNCGCGGFYNQLSEQAILRELDKLFGLEE